MSDSGATLSDLIDRCAKARAALDHATSALEQANTRSREIHAEIAQLEVERDAGAAESAALSAAGIISKLAPGVDRRLSSLKAELDALGRVQNGGVAAVRNLRGRAAKCRDDLNTAIQTATAGVRDLANQKYVESLQSLRDAFYVIEEIDDRPMLSRNTEIIDVEPGADAFRSTTPSAEIESMLEEFRPALDEYRRIASQLAH